MQRFCRNCFVIRRSDREVRLVVALTQQHIALILLHHTNHENLRSINGLPHFHIYTFITFTHFLPPVVLSPTIV